MKKMRKKGGGVLLRISNSRSRTFQAWTERSPYTGGQDSGRSTTTDVRGGIQINQKAMRSFIRTHNGGEPLFFEQCQRGLNAV